MNALIRWYLLVLLVVMGFMPQILAGQSSYELTLKTIEEKVYYYPLQAEKMLDSLLRQHPMDIENEYHGELNFIKGYLAYHKGEMDTALNHLETALMTFTRNDQPESQGKCYLIMGWIAEGDSYLEQAKINYYETIRLFDDQPGANTGLAYLGIARCKKILNEAYREELIKGVEYLEAVGKDEFSLYAHFVYLMIKINEPGSTKQLLEITDRYPEVGLDDKVPNVYKALASYYLQIKELDSAHIYVDKAIRSFDDSYPGVSLIPALHQLKGSIYYAQKNFEAARRQYLLALKLYESHDQMTRSFYAYNGLYRLDLKEKNYKSAVENLVKAHKYREQTDLKEKQRMAKALETAGRLNLLNEEIYRLKTTTKNMTYLSLFLFGFIVAFIIFLVFRIRWKKQKKERFNAELQALATSLRERELSIQNLEKNKENILKAMGQNSNHIKVEEIYPELWRILAENYKSLTKTELSCALMFAMGITEETIAKVQNVQKDTIRKTKLQIRKKLDLSNDTNLGLYFQKNLKLQP